MTRGWCRYVLSSLLLIAPTASAICIAQAAPQEAAATLRATPTARQRALQFLGHMKYLACFPLALAA